MPRMLGSRRLLPAALVIALATVPAGLVRAGQAFRFDWPVPCRVGVTSHFVSDSLLLVTHYTLHLYRTPHPGELKLQKEDLQLWDATLGNRRLTAPNPAMTQLMGIMAFNPPIVLSREGRFLRAPFEQEDLARAMEEAQKSGGGAIDSAAWGKLRDLLLDPGMRAEFERDEDFDWTVQIGAWPGLDLGPGEQTRVEMLVPIPMGESVDGFVTFRNVGPDDRNPRVTRLRAEAVLGGKDVREAVERRLRRQAPVRGEPLGPSGTALRDAAVRSQSIAMVDPLTLRPTYTVRVGQLDMTDTLGVESSTVTLQEDYYEWDPPLTADAALDAVSKSGLEAFYKMDYEKARQDLSLSARQGSRNPDTYSYLAEAYRRLGEPGDAALFARRALALDPRSAFAHQELADIFNPQFGAWLRADAESTWTHLLRAVECDSTDGNGWMAIVREAQRRGRRDVEDHAFARLLDTEFLTPAVCAYARWLLRDLPESTLIVTNGDLDTYPGWALQRIRTFRPDVAITNVSLLSLPWYCRRVRDTLNVRLPFEDAALDTLAPYYSESESAGVYVGDQILRGWVEMDRTKRLQRPLAIAGTVSLERISAEARKGFAQAGGVWRRAGPSARGGIDLEATRHSLDGLRAADFRGPSSSDRDRSPVRRESSPRLLDDVLAVWRRYADELAATGHRREALETLSRATSFAKGAEAPPSALEDLAEQEARIRAGAHPAPPTP